MKLTRSTSTPCRSAAAPPEGEKRPRPFPHSHVSGPRASQPGGEDKTSVSTRHYLCRVRRLGPLAERGGDPLPAPDIALTRSIRRFAVNLTAPTFFFPTICSRACAGRP
jgi:hypothetical protein